MRRMLIFSLLLGLVYASDSEACSPEGSKQDGCPLGGNGDYYGLGVRVGIYSTWLTSWFANNLLPGEISGSLETNSIFLLALFGTVFFYSVQTDGIRVVDVLVIHQLCMGFVFSVMSLWGYRTMYYRTEGPGGRKHFGGIGTHFRLVLLGMISCYAVWFWLKGVKDGLSSCDRRMNCGGLDTFFFVPMKAEGLSARTVQLIVSSGMAIYYGIMVLAALAGGIHYLSRRLRGKKAHWELIPPQDDEVNLTKREFTTWYKILTCFNLFWIVFSIVQVEVTLNLNHMTNVIGGHGLVGPGQLIALAIGLLSLARVLYMIAQERVPWLPRRKEDDETETKKDTAGAAPTTPTKQTYTTAGIGLTMQNTGSIYSPIPPATPATPASRPSGSLSSSSPGTTLYSSSSPPTGTKVPTAATVAATPQQPVVSLLPPLPAVAPRHEKCSLAHRILLAWLPWLGMFDYFRHPITPRLRQKEYALLGDEVESGQQQQYRRHKIQGSILSFDKARRFRPGSRPPPSSIMMLKRKDPTSGGTAAATESPTSFRLLSTPPPRYTPTGLSNVPADVGERIGRTRSAAWDTPRFYEGEGYDVDDDYDRH